MGAQLKIVLTGATGMIGRGVLMACLEHAAVSKVLSISRRPSGVEHAKLEEVIHQDFLDWSAIRNKFSGSHACFFCLGGTSMGRSEAEYRKFTVDMPLALAEVLLKETKDLTFCYISGGGTNRESSGMWQRVKAEAEDRLLKLPMKAAYMFRPAGVELLGGAKPNSLSLTILYTVFRPLLPIFRRFPKLLTTNKKIGQAMLQVTLAGHDETTLESKDINEVAARLLG